MAAVLPGSIHVVNSISVSVLFGALQQLQAVYSLKRKKLRMEGADPLVSLLVC